MRLALLTLLLLGGCDIYAEHVKCMNPDGSILIDEDVFDAYAVYKVGTIVIRRLDGSYMETSASCLITQTNRKIN